MSDRGWEAGPWDAESARPARLPRVEDLPAAGDGYDRRAVEEAFDAFYRHAAQLDATLRLLESFEAFQSQAAGLRSELRSLRGASWGPAPSRPAWTAEYRAAYAPPRFDSVLPDAAPRVAVEAAFIILVAVGAALAGLSTPLVVVLVLAAWLLVGLVEVVASVARPPFRRPRAVEPAPAPVAEADVAAPEPVPDPVVRPAGEATMFDLVVEEEAGEAAMGEEAVAAVEPAAGEEPGAVAEPEPRRRRRWRRRRDREPETESPPSHVRVLGTAGPTEPEVEAEAVAVEAEPAPPVVEEVAVEAAAEPESPPVESVAEPEPETREPELEAAAPPATESPAPPVEQVAVEPEPEERAHEAEAEPQEAEPEALVEDEREPAPDAIVAAESVAEAAVALDSEEAELGLDADGVAVAEEVVAAASSEGHAVDSAVEDEVRAAAEVPEAAAEPEIAVEEEPPAVPEEDVEDTGELDLSTLRVDKPEEVAPVAADEALRGTFDPWVDDDWPAAEPEDEAPAGRSEEEEPRRRWWWRGTTVDEEPADEPAPPEAESPPRVRILDLEHVVEAEQVAVPWEEPQRAEPEDALTPAADARDEEPAEPPPLAVADEPSTGEAPVTAAPAPRTLVPRHRLRRGRR